MQPDLVTIQSSPLWHFHLYDLLEQTFMLLRIEENLFRKTSFLDERVQQETRTGFRYELRHLATTFPDTGARRRPSMYIFHIGHCGSTLLSRALGSSQRVLPIREPLTLRHLARDLRELDQPWSFLSGEGWAWLMSTVTQTLTRRFRDDQLPVIKATSTCNNLIDPVLGSDDQPRAILMYLPLEPYLAGLIGKNPPAYDLRGQARTRLEEWMKITGARPVNLHEMKPAQLAVMSWLGSMNYLLEARKKFTNRVRLLDFEAFLEDPDSELAQTADFFGLAGETENIVSAYPDISTGYSKKPDEPYSAYTRKKILYRARAEKAVEIREGLEWAGELIRETPALEGCGNYL
jgi:hypothetical protein